MNYDEIVDEIINIPRFSSGVNKSGKDNLLKVMEQLGNPHKATKSIHIAGTNGKGSTARFVMDILAAKGYSVGIFTSPHLVRINERIGIATLQDDRKNILVKDISDEDFVCCYNLIKEAVDIVQSNGGLHLSFFEFIFAMATVYFFKKGPDYVIYETGLGGRLDATNILEPEITAITSIGLDHTDYLGDTIEKVAAEKAGIIKHKIPVVYCTGDEAADKVILDRATELGCKEINVAKTDYIIYEITNKTIDFSMVNRYYRYHHLKLFVGGATYQVNNAITAIVLCNTLFSEVGCIDQDIIQLALDNFYWPGRMEAIHPNVILDGAHNLDAINRFTECVVDGYGDKEVNLLFAVAGDKDYGPMIDMLCQELSLKSIWVTSINSKRGISSEYIADIFRKTIKKQGKKTEVFYDDSIENAFSQAFELVKETDDILFCVGSLYLIGSIKEIAQEVLV